MIYLWCVNVHAHKYLTCPVQLSLYSVVVYAFVFFKTFLKFSIPVAHSVQDVCLRQLVVNSCFGRKQKSFVEKWRIISDNTTSIINPYYSAGLPYEQSPSSHQSIHPSKTFIGST